jgi:hypothetical protein
MLSRTGMGMGLVALTSTLGGGGHLQAGPPIAGESLNPLAPKKPRRLPAKPGALLCS